MTISPLSDAPGKRLEWWVMVCYLAARAKHLSLDHLLPLSGIAYGPLPCLWGLHALQVCGDSKIFLAIGVMIKEKCRYVWKAWFIS